VLVLAIDTSTPIVTAGVVSLKRPHEILAEAQRAAGGDGSAEQHAFPTSPPYRTLAERTVDDAFGHAEHLMPLVTAALAEAGHLLREVEAVVVGIGPGPFTGLRVGMATAESLGDALGVPVHGVPSHDAMARRVAADGDLLVVTDARRREVYLSAYTPSAARRLGPVVVPPAAIADLLAEHRLTPRQLTGAGAPLVAAVTGLPVREPSGPLSEQLVAGAVQPLLTGALPGPLTPLYLRRPDAVPPGAPKPVLPQAEPGGQR
jgi:tRNA threonylcarbamoyl adenosine modification protein YeaZ